MTTTKLFRVPATLRSLARWRWLVTADEGSYVVEVDPVTMTATTTVEMDMPLSPWAQGMNAVGGIAIPLVPDRNR